MSQTIRFPYNRSIPNKGPAETTQIITIFGPDTTIARGGTQNYTSVAAWKIAGEQTESPYPCVVLEIFASAATTIGNGTNQMIGLYGQVDTANVVSSAADRRRTLLGIIGLNLGSAMPQIPVVQQAGPASDIVGFSQVFSNVSIYDRLSIGGVFGDVPIAEGITVTVTARPIRQRDYLG